PSFNRSMLKRTYSGILTAIQFVARTARIPIEYESQCCLTYYPRRTNLLSVFGGIFTNGMKAESLSGID
ncbi:MAG: hypothetical protein P8O73_08510, partial [SAR324 cluster bacterium]|nr:hypothetical protein [SAR324 cluster bacterium]